MKFNYKRYGKVLNTENIKIHVLLYNYGCS